MSSLGSKSSNSVGEQRKTAMGSSWIKRLCPDAAHSHILIPFHLKSCFALQSLPNNPPLPPPQQELITGFGPFRVQTRNSHATVGRAAALSPFFQYRRQLTTGILGNTGDESRLSNSLRPSQELIDESPSPLPVDCRHVATGKGSASRDDGHPSSSRNFYNTHAFGLNTAQHLNERQNYCFSSEPEEPFSYWNMGRVERRNFVSSLCPVSSSTMASNRKRTANTYGFISSKFRRFCSED